MNNTLLHLLYKHSGTSANRKYEELSYPFKIRECATHSSNSIENAIPLFIVSSVVKMRPHPAAHPPDSASYKEVTPPLGI